MSVKIVVSPFLRMQNNIVYHSLYGNPVRVDADVNRFLLSLREPRDLTAIKDVDCLCALKELIQRGHIISFHNVDTEYERWQKHMRACQKESLFSGGIVFLVTTACNLSCIYCMCSHTIDTARVMAYTTAETALQQYMQYEQVTARPTLIFTGGEPLLQADLIQKLCEYASRKYPNRLKFRIITNGTLIDSEIAAFLKKYHFDIVVSLDGDENTNRYRVYHDGSPSYAAVITGIETLLSQGVDPRYITLSAVYHGNGLRTLLLYMSRWGVTNMNVNVNNLVMQESPHSVAQQLVAMRSQARGNRINVSGRWAVPAHILRARGSMAAVCSGAARSKLFVQPGGELTLCDYHPKVVGKIEHLEQLTEINTEEFIFGTWDECKGCEIEGFCSPCILEKEVIHKGSLQYQQQKCKFLKSCTRLLLQEE